ncbi:MAG: extracellular solute-binding protein [Albidovulum sp.]|nr:extracellular solute-binding protein [Albidovulum sp.]
MSIVKTIRIALLGAVSAGALAFGFLAGPAASQDRSIKVWFGRENFIPEDQFATFHAENPDITVEFEVIRLEDVNAQLVLAMRSGNAPDIVQIRDRDVGQLAINNVVKDFTSWIEEFKNRFPETYEQLSPLAWTGASAPDGKIYGAAVYSTSIYLAYRTDWLEEVGMQPPLETTDRVLEAARRITESGDSRKGFSLLGCCNAPTWELPLFLSMGGQIIDGVPQIDNEIGIEWIKFYQTLMNDGSAHPDTPSWDSGQMRAAFIGGRAGMMYEGEHIYVPTDEQMPYGEGKWAFERLPTRTGQEGPHVQAGYAFPFIVTTGNEDEEAAMLALEYLARLEFAKQVSIRYQPTTNTAVSEDAEYRAAKPWAVDVAPIAATMVTIPTHPTRAIQVYDVLKDLRDRMVADPGADAADMASEYQRALNSAAGL